MSPVLTTREAHIHRLIAAGLSNYAIATQLRISEKTVECHINRLFSKLQLRPDNTSHRRVLATIMYHQRERHF
ncbi:helix-turn-helix domain-containing protein [Pseudonocardia sp. TRM90224]|uniref:helix-turn-helix domain-containing protein n=1 Tax=Pseudonocardia sp. TRM90224 TaxID=2812678 RepID=UPI001E491DF2|nr:LuxR C-terminal-related transcriptional regulator [Pseudonocardia sp. TRM90224]